MSNIQEKHHRYLTETLALREELEGGFLILAERLKKIRDERLWDDGNYEGFPDFLREMRVSEATASKLIGVYEKFILIGGIDPKELVTQGWTNLSIFLPIIGNKKDAQDIFTKVAPLDRTDALRVYQEMKSGKSMEDCSHEWVELRYCRKCNLRERLYEEGKK